LVTFSTTHEEFVSRMPIIFAEASLLIERIRKAIDAEEVLEFLNISGHDLQKLDLSYLLTDELLATGTNLDDAVLIDAELIRADFKNASLNRACLRNCQLGLAAFDHSSMREICMENVSFVLGDCEESDLEGANLSRSVLTDASFWYCCLNHANFESVQANKVGMLSNEMIGANLKNGSFVEATFMNCDLTGSDLSGGDFTRAKFRNVTLKAVKWGNAILDGAQFDPGVSPR
jgi:uncharacterized protein YjbI with pentapeptide repeats